MNIKNLYASTIYKGIFVLLCAAALYIDLGFGSGRPKWYTLNYYTILSNLVCVVFFSAAFIASIRALAAGKRVFHYAPRTEGAVVFCITVTGLVYHFLLAPTHLRWAGTLFFHTVI